MTRHLLGSLFSFITAAFLVVVLLAGLTLRLAYGEATPIQLFTTVFAVCFVASVALAVFDPEPTHGRGYSFPFILFLASILITWPLGNRMLFALLAGTMITCGVMMWSIYTYRNKADERRDRNRLTAHMAPRWSPPQER